MLLTQESAADNSFRYGFSCRTDPGVFRKLFHQMEGISANEYLKRIRIEKAKHLLLTKNLKIFEVSNAVSFHL